LLSSASREFYTQGSIQYLREFYQIEYSFVGQQAFRRKKEELYLREKIGQAKQPHLGLGSRELIYRI